MSPDSVEELKALLERRHEPDTQGELAEWYKRQSPEDRELITRVLRAIVRGEVEEQS